jgi:hypothetical protein
MNRLPEGPLADRVVIVGLIATLGVVFALVFWTVRLTPSADGPLLWRQPAERPGLSQPGQGARQAPAGLPAGGGTI